MSDDISRPVPPCITNIFSTNSKILEEAADTFYTTKTLRLTIQQLKECLEQELFSKFARRIQIIGCASLIIHADMHDPASARERDSQASSDFRSLLDRTLKLPKLQSLTISSESFASVSGDTDEPFHYLRVRSLASTVDLGEMTYTDIGRFHLDGPFSRIDIVHPNILEMWASVKNTPEEFNAFEEVAKLSDDDGSDDVTEIVRTSLRLWVGLWQLNNRCQDIADQLSTDDWRTTAVFLQCALRDNGEQHMMLPEGRDTACALRELGPQNDPAILEWATEVLTANTAAYLAFGDSGGFRETHWAELDDYEWANDIIVVRDSRTKI